MCWGARNMGSSSSFFFQAEDGIGGGRVTGVQTCALQISSALMLSNIQIKDHILDDVKYKFLFSVEEVNRSEERRVGKKRRSRWRQHHYKKKMERRLI